MCRRERERETTKHAPEVHGVFFARVRHTRGLIETRGGGSRANREGGEGVQAQREREAARAAAAAAAPSARARERKGVAISWPLGQRARARESERV